MPPSLLPLIASSRVSPQTRRVLEDRMNLSAYERQYFDADEFALLGRVSEAVLPQVEAGTHVPYAAMIDQRLSRGEGLGWRYAEMPEDGRAYRIALRLVGEAMGDRDAGALPELMERIQRKEMDGPELTMSRWLEGLKVDLTRFWLGHPDGMAAIGYGGFADDALQPQDPATGVMRP